PLGFGYRYLHAFGPEQEIPDLIGGRSLTGQLDVSGLGHMVNPATAALLAAGWGSKGLGDFPTPYEQASEYAREHGQVIPDSAALGLRGLAAAEAGTPISVGVFGQLVPKAMGKGKLEGRDWARAAANAAQQWTSLAAVSRGMTAYDAPVLLAEAKR